MLARCRDDDLFAKVFVRNFIHRIGKCGQPFETARQEASVFRRHFAVTQYADWIRQLGDEEQMPITDAPENIRVLVAGGAGKHSCVIPSWGMTKSVTVPITD